jgi:phosphoribosyl-AMP cyclohydrolase
MSALRQIFNSSEVVFGKIATPGYDELIAPQTVVDGERLGSKGLAAFLMQGYATQEALDMTLETGLVTFWSRSQGRLWVKGASSGNVLRLRGVYMDCDFDSILIDADPAGPTCHTGAGSCFEI